MLIRKNTKAFKTILEIITASQNRPDRDKLIRLYITRAGHTIGDRISIESIQGNATLFYEMNYHAVLGNLESSNRQLHQSDDLEGIYFFRNPSNQVWDETPFEFDAAIKREFASLPELPMVRKKEKSEIFVLTPPNKKSESKARPLKKEAVVKTKIKKVIEKGPKQPDYKLKHKIHFTDLDETVFRKPQLTKKDLLDYYNKIAEYILPYLKDRPLSIRTLLKNGRLVEYQTAKALSDHLQVPDWLQTFSSRKGEEGLLLCNDKNHLLFFVEIGCMEFSCGHARTKFMEMPDYLIIRIESPRGELKKSVVVAITAKKILDGLQLPSFVKTDGHNGIHLYIPLDTKSQFGASKAVAEYICKLIQLMLPDLVILKESEDLSYGKITLDYMLNESSGYCVVPYSLVAGESLTVATPVLWKEVAEGLRLDFSYEEIFRRLKHIGDPLEKMVKKKINADGLLKRMESDYAFLF